MKKVFTLVAVIIAFNFTTANAQTKNTTPKEKTATTAKPMSEEEWMKKNRQTNVEKPAICQPSQPAYAQPSNIIEFQWIRKMMDGKKYTVKLTYFARQDGQNNLQVIIEDPKSLTGLKSFEFFNIAEGMENPELVQTADWKKLTFTYELSGVTIPIEIENLY